MTLAAGERTAAQLRGFTVDRSAANGAPLSFLQTT